MADDNDGIKPEPTRLERIRAARERDRELKEAARRRGLEGRPRRPDPRTPLERIADDVSKIRFYIQVVIFSYVILLAATFIAASR